MTYFYELLDAALPYINDAHHNELNAILQLKFSCDIRKINLAVGYLEILYMNVLPLNQTA